MDCDNHTDAASSMPSGAARVAQSSTQQPTGSYVVLAQPQHFYWMAYHNVRTHPTPLGAIRSQQTSANIWTLSPQAWLIELVTLYSNLWRHVYPHDHVSQFWSSYHLHELPNITEIQRCILQLTTSGILRASQVVAQSRDQPITRRWHPWVENLEFARQAFYMLLLSYSAGLFDSEQQLMPWIAPLDELLSVMNPQRRQRSGAMLTNSRAMASELLGSFIVDLQSYPLLSSHQLRTMLVNVVAPHPNWSVLAAGIRMVPPEGVFDHTSARMPFVMMTDDETITWHLPIFSPQGHYYRIFEGGVEDGTVSPVASEVFGSLSQQEQRALSAIITRENRELFRWFPTPTIFTAVHYARRGHGELTQTRRDENAPTGGDALRNHAEELHQHLQVENLDVFLRHYSGI